MSLSIIVLAAGKGSRMKSSIPKVLHSLGSVPLLGHVINTAKELMPDEIIVVVGHEAEQVIDYVDAFGVSTVIQKEQLGTGHAVLNAMDNVSSDSILVLYGDVPLISTETIENVLDKTSDDHICLLSVSLEDPTGYGRILRDSDGKAVAIREEKDASPSEKEIAECNTGILAGPKTAIHDYLSNLTADNAQGEYYLTDIIESSITAGKSVESVCVKDEVEVQGINSRKQLEGMERKYQLRLADRLMDNGTTLYDRNRIDIRGNLSCGIDSTIDINCVFCGDVTIGKRVQIGPNCSITDSDIGDDSIILANSVIEGAVVGKSCSVGPFARLRPKAQLDDGCKVGNFVEIKKSKIGPSSKISHLSYIGDAEIGSNVNVGAGTITCNYDGVNKAKTKIGDGSFIGSNTALVAPIEIGQMATIGAGSVLSKDAPNDQLTLTRAKQITIPAWNRPLKKDN